MEKLSVLGLLPSLASLSIDGFGDCIPCLVKDGDRDPDDDLLPFLGSYEKAGFGDLDDLLPLGSADE